MSRGLAPSANTARKSRSTETEEWLTDALDIGLQKTTAECWGEYRASSGAFLLTEMS